MAAGVGVAVAVGIGVAVAVGTGVVAGVGVAVAVGIDVAVAAGTGVDAGSGVAVAVGIGVAVAAGTGVVAGSAVGAGPSSHAPRRTATARTAMTARYLVPIRDKATSDIFLSPKFIVSARSQNCPTALPLQRQWSLRLPWEWLWEWAWQSCQSIRPRAQRLPPADSLGIYA